MPAKIFLRSQPGDGGDVRLLAQRDSAAHLFRFVIDWLRYSFVAGRHRIMPADLMRWLRGERPV